MTAGGTADAPVADRRPRLFQYWHRAGRPAEVQALMLGWEGDPAFRYRPFTRRAAARLFARRGPPAAADAFGRCRVPAMQADLFRLLALWLHGGIYVDADVENLGTNRPLLERTDRGFLFLRRGNLATDVMAVRDPRDPLIGHALDGAVANVLAGRGGNAWEMTGPGVLTAAYRRYGPDHPLFRGFRIGSATDLRRQVGFRWDLSYKRSADDWRNVPADAMLDAGA